MTSFFVPLRTRVKSLAKTFSGQLPEEFVRDDQAWVDVAGRKTPALRNGATPLNLNFSVPDRFTAETGGTATIFVRSGGDFARITTSVKKQDGERAIGTLLDRSHPAYRLLLTGQAYVGYATIFGRQCMTHYDPIHNAAGQVIGVRYVGLDISELRSVGMAARIGVTVAALYAIACLIFWRVALPLLSAEAAPWLAVFAILSCLLIGLAVYVLISRNLSRPMADCKVAAQKIAAGDLSAQVHVDRRDNVGQMLQAINGISVGLAAVVTQVRQASDGINTAAHQIASGTVDLSARTEAQAGSLEQTAAAMEQLTSTVKQNADNAGQANALVATAAKLAEDGGGIVGRVIVSMGEIKSGAQRIEDIVGIIDGIAFQTNILALNAAVEAARAGAQGRGFAVVATEVQALAQRSAEAAKQIKALVVTSMSNVDSGCELVDSAGQTTSQMVGAIQQASVLMKQISDASAEQSKGLDEVNHAIGLMDEVTQQNAALVEQAAAAATSMQEQAVRLSETVAVFKTAE